MYMESLKIPEASELQQFDTVTDKEVIEINAKLEVLKLVGGIVDSLREGLTRQLEVNGIKDENLLTEKLESLEIKSAINTRYKHYTEDVGEIEP